MAKILTDIELCAIIHQAVNDKYVIDCKDQYTHFLEDLGNLICDHFGGELGNIIPDELTNRFIISFNTNENLPFDGGIFKQFDTDVKWVDGKEV